MDSIQIEKVIQGDSLIEMKNLKDNSVDLIFADPPYWMRVEGVLKRPEGTDFDGCIDEWDNAWETNADYAKWTREWLSECKRILKDTGSIWVIGAMQCIYTIGGIMQELGFWFLNDVVWHKLNPTPNFKGTKLGNHHETLIWAKKSKDSKYTFNYKTAKELNCDAIDPELYAKGERRQMGSVWRFPVCSGNERLKDNEGKKVHSTQKPIALLQRIISISSKPNDIVFDPFGGTMTTAAAAKSLGRNFITIERNPLYIEAGLDRLKTIEYSDTPISRAEFDIKPIKVTLSDMIEDGFLTLGEPFFLKGTNDIATLKENGYLEYDNKDVSIHALAATLLKSRQDRLNGFSYWYVERNGEKILLDDIRNNYRESLKNTF